MERCASHWGRMPRFEDCMFVVGEDGAGRVAEMMHSVQ